MQITFLPKEHFYESVKPDFSYALLNNKLEALHSEVHCRDFITDIFGCELSNSKMDLYKFKWTPGTININEEETFRLAISYKRPFLDQELENISRLLNQVALALEFNPVTVHRDIECVFWVSFGKEWIQWPITVSLLTLLLRIGSLFSEGMSLLGFLQVVQVQPGKLMCPSDASFVATAMSNFHNLLANKKPLQHWNDYDTIYNLHYQSGIASYKWK